MMQDNDCLETANGLKNRDGPDGVHRTASRIADHADALDGRIDAEDGIGVQTRVRAAQDDSHFSGFASFLGHWHQMRWCLIVSGDFAFGM